MAALAATAVSPAAGQIADRTGQNRDRNAVVVRPGQAERNGQRGRASGGEVEVAAERARWNESCAEYRRGRRDDRHGWFDGDGRYDCDPRAGRFDGRNDRDGRYDDRYDRDRRPVGVAVRSSLAREHVALMSRLDREHDRWHRTHGWHPRNRGWLRAHDALHRNLERDHERWHRRLGVPFTLWPDRAGRVVVIR
jgi:hypothetical protein